MRVVFLTEGLSHSGDGPGECVGGEVPWLVVLFLLCISSSFGLFSCVHPGPHQMLLCWWHGKLPHHLFLLGGLHQPGPCGARWALRTGSTSSPRSIQECMWLFLGIGATVLFMFLEKLYLKEKLRQHLKLLKLFLVISCLCDFEDTELDHLKGNAGHLLLQWFQSGSPCS